MSIVGAGVISDNENNKVTPFYWSNTNAKPVKLQSNSNVSIASDINDLGQIVGFSGESTIGTYIPIIWDTPNSKPTTLPLLEEYIAGVAKSINNLGRIVGFIGKTATQNINSTFLPVTWATPTDKPTILDLFDGYTSGIATGINDLGQIVGYNFNFDNDIINSIFVIWTNTKPTQIPLPAAISDVFFFTQSLAFSTGINNLGQISSFYVVNNDKFVPIFLSSANSTPTTLRLPNDKTQGLASGINNSGQIVGISGNSFAEINSIILPVIWNNANSKPTALQLPDGYDSVFALGISGPSISPTPISNICFPAGTPVQTDQGLIHIDDIDPRTHTINNQPILHITKTTTLDNYLISFEKNSLERNIPSRKTLMTKDHKIRFEGNLVPAYRFLDYSDKVKKVKYSGEILYNVLLAEYDTINVNNLECETLHPDNIIAKLYMRELKEQPRLICQLNSSLENKDFASYTEVVHRLTHNL